MTPLPVNSIMSLEELEKKLYTSGDIRKESAAPEQKRSKIESPALATDWASEQEKRTLSPERGKSVAGKWLIAGILLAIVIIGSVGYYYISALYKTKDLAFDAETADNVLIARPFDVTVTLENKSQVPLRDGRVSITLPEGIIAVDAANDRQAIDDAVGDMAAGDHIERTYSVVAVQDEQSLKKLDVNFSYLPQNINTRFERNKTLEVHIGQSAISLDFTTPQQVFNAENFDIGMRYRNVSDLDVAHAYVRLLLPPEVSIKQTSIKPDHGDMGWTIDALKPQEEGNVSVTGTFAGTGKDVFDLKSQIVAVINGQEYVINEKTASIGIAAPPLSLEILANNTASYVTKPEDTIVYTLKYRNNTDVGLNDAIITAKLRGELFDITSVKSHGSFNSVTNTLTWNAAAIPELKLIAPQTEGSVDFTVQTKPTYPIRRMFDKNYLLRVAGEIDSPTVPYGVASDRTIGLATSEIKVAGDIVLTATIDRVGSTQPLQANKPATYTITLSIVNYATDMRDIKVLSSLEPGVTWTGVTKGSNGSVPTFNDRTGEIAWTIDRIIATKGVIGTPTTATFQVQIVPNVTQTGTINITKNMILSATDDFTGATVVKQIDGLRIAGIGK